MKRKTAEKLLMSYGFDRNAARYAMRKKDPQTETGEWLIGVIRVGWYVIGEFEVNNMACFRGFHLRGNGIACYGERSPK